MKIPISLVGSNKDRVDSLGNEKCINLYAEKSDDKRDEQALIAVPGLVEKVTLGA